MVITSLEQLIDVIKKEDLKDLDVTVTTKISFDRLDDYANFYINENENTMREEFEDLSASEVAKQCVINNLNVEIVNLEFKANEKMFYVECSDLNDIINNFTHLAETYGLNISITYTNEK